MIPHMPYFVFPFIITINMFDYFKLAFFHYTYTHTSILNLGFIHIYVELQGKALLSYIFYKLFIKVDML